MLLHPCMLTLSTFMSLRLSSKFLCRAFYCSRDSFILWFWYQPSLIYFHNALCLFDPLVKFYLQKQSFLSLFMSIDVHHLIAYLLIGLFLPTSTLYLGRRPRNTSMPWYLQTSVVSHLVFDQGFSSLAPG